MKSYLHHIVHVPQKKLGKLDNYILISHHSSILQTLVVEVVGHNAEENVANQFQSLLASYEYLS